MWILGLKSYNTRIKIEKKQQHVIIITAEWKVRWLGPTEHTYIRKCQCTPTKVMYVEVYNKIRIVAKIYGRDKEHQDYLSIGRSVTMACIMTQS